MGMSGGARTGETVPGCLLCDIVRGDVQVTKVVETEQLIAYVARKGAARGHCVIFPKRHTPSLHDVEDAVLAQMMVTIKELARAAEVSTYNVLQNNGAAAGQTAFHAHLHWIPRWSPSEGLHVDHDWPGGFDHSEIVKKIDSGLRRVSDGD